MRNSLSRCQCGGAAVYEAVRDEWNCTGWRGQADLVDTARGG